MSNYRAPGVVVVPKSGNIKIGVVAATYVAQITCPALCPYLGNGCYAEQGHTAFVTRRLNAQAREAKHRPRDLAYLEAQGIDTLDGTRPLRLHVVGDCVDTASAVILADAAERYMQRGQGRGVVWTYTHSWRTIPREAWGLISVNASVESLTDADAAMRRGYGVAMTVPTHPEDGKGRMVGNVRVVPCPNQTRGVHCGDCPSLCTNADSMRDRGVVLALAAHGVGAKRVRAHLADKTVTL